MPEPTSPPKPAVAIPDHELIRPIGRGSYGEVWLARSVLGEYRAVKIIRRDTFDRDRPVERELEGIQKFEPISRTQENQVHILHVGRFAEGFYYVMELADPAEPEKEKRGKGAEGTESAPDVLPFSPSPLFSPAQYTPRTLRSEVRQRSRLPVAECIDLALKLTDALAHLHGHSLVHRDVKPSNIIFVRGQPKLADIGLVASSDSSMSCVGTEGFLPPEGPGKPQADLYALGKVLYEICTGRDRHDFPELPTMLRDDPQRRPLEEFNEVILKACDPDVRIRYPTARAMHADLELLRTGKSLQQVRRRERLLANTRRVLSAAAILLVVAGVSLRLTRKPERVLHQDARRLIVDKPIFWGGGFAATRQFDFSSDGQRIVFAGRDGLSVWDAKTSITRLLSLPEFGTFEKGPSTNQWRVPGSSRAMARWAPDSQHFVFQAIKIVRVAPTGPVGVCTFFLVNANTAELRQMGPQFPADEQATDLCWLPDGSAITYTDERGRFYTQALNGERDRWLNVNLPGKRRASLGGYSPDGKWLLLSTDNGSIDANEDHDVWVIPHLGGPSQRLTQSPGTDAFPTWSPDGASVYYVSSGERKGTNTWGIWKTPVDRKSKLPKGPSTEVFVRSGQKLFHPKFVAGGRTLAYAVEAPNMRVWVSDSAAIDKGMQVVRGQDPVLSPDGRTVYFVGETPEQQGVYAIGQKGDKDSLRKITDLKPLSHGLSLSPDGQLLAMFGYDGKRFGVFVAPTAGGNSRLVEEFAVRDLIAPVWSPDGDWLAYTVDKQLIRASSDGRVREPLVTLHRWQGWTVRWSPDGKHLAAFADKSPSATNEMSGVYVVSVADKTWKMITPESEEPQEKEGLEWHPSGEYLTYMFYGPEASGAQIRRAYPDGRPTDVMIQQTNHWDYVGVWAPDGRRFFFYSSDRPAHMSLHLYDLETKQITHDLRDGSLPGWSHDGRTAVWTTRDTLRYFEMIEGFR